MINFDFLEKGLEIVSPIYFVYDFSRKTDQISFIALLHLILEIFVNIYIAFVCKPGCDVTNFEISFIFQIKPFFHMTETSRQKFKYLENE